MNKHEILLQHAETLQRQLEDHRRLLEGAACGQHEHLDFCPHLRCPHERELRGAVKDVVDTLEKTRTSFKSKQLEKLRKRM